MISQVEVVIDRFEGQSSRAIFDYVESMAPAVDEVPKTAQDASETKEGVEQSEESKDETPVTDEDAVRRARLDRIRQTTDSAKDIDMILSGPCQHLLCLEAKKANAIAAEACANADLKNGELKSLCESSAWKQAARAVEDEQVDRARA